MRRGEHNFIEEEQKTGKMSGMFMPSSWRGGNEEWKGKYESQEELG